MNKCLTTIQKWSREQANGSRNGKNLFEKDCDIVLSALRNAAVQKRTPMNLRNIGKIMSNDMPLGNPFNVCGYAWLLSVMAKLTGFKPGMLIVSIFNAHIYENQIELAKEQIQRSPMPFPDLVIDNKIRNFIDIEQSTIDDYRIINYNHHDPIKYPFSV